MSDNEALPEKSPSSAGYRILLVEDREGESGWIHNALEEIEGDRLTWESVDLSPFLDDSLKDGNVDLVLLRISSDRDEERAETSLFEPLSRLKSVSSQTPIIVLCDREDRSLAEKAIAWGAQDFFSKSDVRGGELLRSIQRAIQRMQAIRELIGERDLLRMVIDTLPDLIYVKDRECRYVLSNRSQLEFIGAKDQDEAKGKTVRDFYPPDIATSFIEDEQAVLETGVPLLGREELSVDHDGEHKWVSTTKAPWRDSHQRILGLVGMTRDITKRKLAEQEAARYSKELHIRNAEMEADLKMATEMQRALLPHQYPSFPSAVSPDNSGFKFSHFYESSAAIGGDFFSVNALSDTTAGIFICDVMGHNIQAALIAAILDGLIEQLASIATDPGPLLTEVNRGLMGVLQKADRTIFASAFYLVADVSTGEIRYANAGHPHPLHLNRSTSGVKTLSPHETLPLPALGLDKDSVYTTTESRVEKDDLILLYTDGIYEVTGLDSEEYGMERLVEALSRRNRLPLPQVVSGIIEEVRDFSVSEKFTDDVCLLCFEAAHLGIQSQKNPNGQD